MSVEIVTYSDKYQDDVSKIIHNFYEEALNEYESFTNPEAIIDTIQSAQHENAFLLIVDGVCQGILYGVVTRSVLNGGDMFQEVIWYINKEYRNKGVNLLKETEKILKERGIISIIMVALENSMSQRLKTFYERLGFKAMETHYIRSL